MSDEVSASKKAKKIGYSRFSFFFQMNAIRTEAPIQDNIQKQYVTVAISPDHFRIGGLPTPLLTLAEDTRMDGGAARHFWYQY